jgi:hypothetical protein
MAARLRIEMKTQTLILTDTAGNFCVLFTDNDGYTLMRRLLKAETRLSSRIVLRAAQKNRNAVRLGTSRFKSIVTAKVAWSPSSFTRMRRRCGGQRTHFSAVRSQNETLLERVEPEFFNGMAMSGLCFHF